MAIGIILGIVFVVLCIGGFVASYMFSDNCNTVGSVLSAILQS